MGLLHPTREITKPRSALKSQLYPAQIITNDDSKHPDGAKRQRTQIRIPQLHRNVPDDQLPWSMPQQGGQMNAKGGVGSVDVPPIGAKTMVQYDEEDPHTLYYTNSPTTDDVAKDNELLNEDYPSTKGHVDHAGNKVAVNTKEGKETITDTHKSGSTFHRDKDGNLYLYAPGNLILGAKGEVTIAAKGGAQLHASGGLSLKGSRIDLNGSDGKKEPTAVGLRQRPQTPSPGGQTSL